MKDLRIVIPAHNEEESIAVVIDRVKKACPSAEIIVVDDASSDHTAQIAKTKDIILVSNQINRGKGGATKVGFDQQTQKEIKYYAFIDADDTYPAEGIPELWRLCSEKGYNLAIGSRFLGPNKGMPGIRKLGNKIFAVMLSLYSGSKTTDTSTGLRVFNSQLLPMVKQLPDGLDFDTAMTSTVLFEKLGYIEIPIDYYKRTGKSNLNSFKDGYRFLKVIMNATRKYRPCLFYCTLGIPFILLSTCLKIWKL